MPTPLERGDAWHAAILAGGASRRLGRDKAFTRVGGHRLVDLAVASVQGASTIWLVMGSRERLEGARGALPGGVTAVPDDRPGHGPMGGLRTALRRHPGEWLAVLAVDLPLVPPGWWVRLASFHRDGALALVPSHAPGRWEPLAALYHGSLAAELTAWMDRDDASSLVLRSWLDDLDRQGKVVAVPTTSLPAGSLRNVNRPEDVDAVDAALRAREFGAR